MNRLIKTVFHNPIYVLYKAISLFGSTYLSVIETVLNVRIVECNLCGWRGAGFRSFTGPNVTYLRRGAVCPACRSLERHRALAMLLEKRGVGATVLAVSPDPTIERVFAKYNARAITLDLDPMRGDVCGDITLLPIANDSISLVLCLHVLEHVKNAGGAVREIHRILRLDGYAVLQVPFDKNAESTIEYDIPNPKEEGHVRKYGRDFATILLAEIPGKLVEMAELVDEQQMAYYGIEDAPFLLVVKR